jgi:hypothetical protein
MESQAEKLDVLKVKIAAVKGKNEEKERSLLFIERATPDNLIDFLSPTRILDIKTGGN